MFLCVLCKPVHVLVIEQQQYVPGKISLRVPTRIVDVSILQYNPEKKMRKNTLRYLIFCYMVYTRLRVILVAEHRYVPFFLYMVRLGVIHTLVGRES